MLFPIKLVRADDAAGRRLAINLVLAFLPAAAAGLVLDDWIDAHLFGLWPIVTAWFVGGVAILVAGWTRKAQGAAARGLEALTPTMALAIGVAQCVAMWPGTSRSLVTMVGGVAIGLSLAAAVEFSFLFGVLTLSAATAYKLVDAGPVMFAAYGVVTPLMGTAAAGLSAAVAVAWMVAYLKRHRMQLFGYYRIALASGVAALLLIGAFPHEPRHAPPEAAVAREAPAPLDPHTGKAEAALPRPVGQTRS